MPTNREYLDQLATESPDKLKAWFDAEHNDDLAAEKVISRDAAHSNDANAHLKASEDLSDGFTDSREKLEADVRQILYSAYMLAWTHGHENRRGNSFEKLHGEFYNLLDRQAAITANANKELIEWQAATVARLQKEVDRLQRRNDELRTSYDKLKRERDYWREQMLNCVIAACRPGGYTKGMMDYPREDEYAEPSLLVTDAIESTRDFNADIARLTAERDNLASDLLTCNREREQLRKHLGIALDHAHDICSLVDIDGNVLDVGD